MKSQRPGSHILVPIVIGLLVLLISLSRVMPSDSIETIELLRAQDFIVRLKVKSVASMADTNWLRIEFENLSNTGYRIKSLYCKIEREDSNRTTGGILRSGNIFSGNSIDLFPHYFDSTHPAKIFIQPGIYETYQYLSDYSSTLLGLPTEDTIEVRAVLHMKVNWQFPEFINTPPDGIPFEFLWVYPDRAGFEAMRERMRYLLQYPLRPQHSIIERTLMSISEVADSIPTVEILDRLAGKISKPRSYFVLSSIGDRWRRRPNLMAYLDSSRASDPIVVEYIEREIENGNRAIISSLCMYGKNFWGDSFAEEVLEAYENSHSPYCLPYLWEHRHKWPEELSIPGRLSTQILQSRSFPIILSENSSKHDVFTVAYTLEALGYSCDTTVLPLIQPYFDDRTQAFDPKNDTMYGVRSPAMPSRICDKALEAVLRILGIDPGDAYSEAMKESDLPEPVTTDSLSRVLRDQMIADINERLSQAVR